LGVGCWVLGVGCWVWGGSDAIASEPVPNSPRLGSEAVGVKQFGWSSGVEQWGGAVGWSSRGGDVAIALKKNVARL